MGKCTPAAWEKAGRALGRVYRSHPWIVADWWVAGDDFPRGVRKAIVQAPDWTGPPYETCKQWGRVARTFPPECRYLHHCDISHHQEAAGLPHELRHSLLEQAERDHWLVNRLRIEVHRLRLRQPLVGGDVFDDLTKLILTRRKYRGILIDPPWPYSKMLGTAGSSDPHYASLSLPDIERLPIPQVALSDAFVFMWCPATMMKHAIAILEGWGFEYKTHAVWDKLVDFGHGFYFRMIHEDLLLGAAPGAPHHFIDRGIESMLRVKRPGQHSAKPAEVHRLVERAVDGPYLELFARQHVNRPGWDCFGNQLEPREGNLQLAVN